MTTVLSRVFFGPGASSVLTTLAVFAVAYVMRPLGALVFGHVGDRLGRRRVLLASMAVMTVAMLVTALLPTREQIGSTAGVLLLLLLRCVMGFSVGGEYTGVMTYLVEGAPPRRRGLVASLASAAGEVGALLAVGVAALTTALTSGPALDSWGWRIPFLFGALLAAGTLIARSTMQESPEFDELKQARATDRAPVWRTLRTRRPALYRTFTISALGSITYYVGITYVSTYLTAVGGFAESDALWLATVASAAVIVVTPFAGMMADRVGRRPTRALRCSVPAPAGDDVRVHDPRPYLASAASGSVRSVDGGAEALVVCVAVRHVM
jgi:MHS family proline/betaine transporter-like MFS transporter